MNVFLLVAGAALMAGLLGGRIYYQHWKEKKELEVLRGTRRKFLESQIERLADTYTLEPAYCSVDGFIAVGHAWSMKKLVFLQAAYYDDKDQELAEPTAAVRAIDSRDLISCDILEESFVRTNKTGGKPQTFVRSIDLKVNVLDLRDPVYLITFLLGEVLAGSPAHLEARSAAHRWEGLIRALIHQAGREPDVTTQLAELELLRRQGLLDDAEHKRQKARLLAVQFATEGRTQDWRDLGKAPLREVTGQASG